jgi:hypothetical protein
MSRLIAIATHLAETRGTHGELGSPLEVFEGVLRRFMLESYYKKLPCVVLPQLLAKLGPTAIGPFSESSVV